MRGALLISLMAAFAVFVGVFGLGLDSEWLNAVFYLIPLSVLPFFLYFRLIKPVDPEFPFGLFIAAFALKLAGGALRYWTLVSVYHGVGDAFGYYWRGVETAEYLRMLDFSILTDYPESGTEGMRYVAALIFAVFPPSLPGSFFLLSGFAFVGSVFFYRAYRVAYPESKPVFYRWMVFFLPSILFWPSSLGKDAWVFFASGFVAYGIVLLIRKGSMKGLMWAASGLSLIMLVRPHIAGFMVIAAGAAYFMFVRAGSIVHVFLWILRGSLLVGVGVFVLSASGEFLMRSGLEEISWQGIVEFYKFRRMASFGGGSGYMSPTVFTFLGPFYAMVTVLFRPLIWEAHNIQSVLTSLEGFLWISLFIARRKAFFARIGSLRNDPVVAFNLCYMLILILALTTASNLGIVARQRVMFVPFMWMLFA